MAVSKRHPTQHFLRAETLVCSVRYELSKGPFIRILYGFFPYRILPFDSGTILLCIYLRGTSEWGVGRRKATWNYHVKYRRISVRVCAHHPTAHLIQWVRCENDNEKPAPTKRPSKTIFIRLYGFVFVCRFQLNSDWKVTSLHSTQCHRRPRFGAEFHVAVSLSSTAAWNKHFHVVQIIENNK